MRARGAVTRSARSFVLKDSWSTRALGASLLMTLTAAQSAMTHCLAGCLRRTSATHLGLVVFLVRLGSDGFDRQV